LLIDVRKWGHENVEKTGQGHKRNDYC
jgi:hypothetical protein